MNEFEQKISPVINLTNGRPSRFSTYLTLISGWYFAGMLLFGFVQQIVVASSIIFLSDAAALLASGFPEKAVQSFMFFLAAMVLPYIPGVLSQYCWQVWKATMVRDFNRFALSNMRSSPRSYANTQASETTTSIFSNSVQTALTQVADYTYDFSQCVFNSLCGSLVIAAVVDPRLGLAYFVTVILCGLYIHRYYATSAEASEAAEKARLDLASITRRIWPNVVLGNTLSLETWTKRLSQQHVHVICAVEKEARIRNGSNLVLSLASVIPIVAICVMLIYANIGDREYLASLFVTMPRMFSILALVSMLLFMVFDFSSVYGQLRVVEDLFADKPKVGTFDFERIVIETGGRRVQIGSLEAFLALCTHSDHVKIRGENGAGKTSLLLAVKEALGEEAFYLPASSMLDLPSKLGSGSTGQIKRNEIEAVFGDMHPILLLLDEWDANLDQENRNLIASSISDAVARGYRVVEISHR
ncbi:hypothetical protein CQ054_22590 [Ochrobactrum sp. MYb29]|nr:hypothetical protein CQ054_22590 [Ochrobactrum sp. MYb29]